MTEAQREARRAKARAAYAANREKESERKKRQYFANLEKSRDTGRRNYHKRKNQTPEKVKDAQFRNRLCKYGLTVAAFQAILTSQKGLCAGCNGVLDQPQIDHCHTTGKVRGLLCLGCNCALGKAYDNPDTLRRLAAYLEKHLTSVESVI